MGAAYYSIQGLTENKIQIGLLKEPICSEFFYAAWFLLVAEFRVYHELSRYSIQIGPLF